MIRAVSAWNSARQKRQRTVDSWGPFSSFSLITCTLAQAGPLRRRTGRWAELTGGGADMIDENSTPGSVAGDGLLSPRSAQKIGNIGKEPSGKDGPI